MINKEKCIFLSAEGFCNALIGTYCTGNNCKFYKSVRQYAHERNRAIMINRQKGNCENCKYTPIKCELIPISDEI